MAARSREAGPGATKVKGAQLKLAATESTATLKTTTTEPAGRRRYKTNGWATSYKNSPVVILHLTSAKVPFEYNAERGARGLLASPGLSGRAA